MNLKYAVKAHSNSTVGHVYTFVQGRFINFNVPMSIACRNEQYLQHWYLKLTGITME